MRNSARPPSNRREKMSPKCRLMSSKASWKRSWAVRVMPLSAFSRSLIDATTSSCWVRRKSSRSSSSRYSSSATRFTRPMASILRRELLVAAPGLVQVAARIVRRGERLLAFHAVTAARLLVQLLAPHASFRLAKLELVDLAHEPGQPLLRVSHLAVDRLDLARAVAMRLRHDRQLGLPPIPLHARLARLRVGPLPLLAEVRSPLGHVRAAARRLLELRTEFPPELDRAGRCRARAHPLARTPPPGPRGSGGIGHQARLVVAAAVQLEPELAWSRDRAAPRSRARRRASHPAHRDAAGSRARSASSSIASASSVSR